MKRSRGFTVVELTIVVAIVGILAAVSISAMRGMLSEDGKDPVVIEQVVKEKDVQTDSNTSEPIYI